MKKLLTLLLVCLLVLGLGACSSKESSATLTTQETQEETKQEVVEKQEEVIEAVHQEEAKEEVKEETKQETKEVIDPEVLKTYKYWVVFYNPDGTELQREALKWGTTPEYYDGIPYYYDGSYDYDFVGWTNKKGQPKELKPITGNTYFYAKYEISTGRKNSSGGSNTPAPDPEYEQLVCLTSTTGTNAYIKTGIVGSDNIKFVFKAKMNKVTASHPFGFDEGYPSGLFLQTYIQGYEFRFGKQKDASDYPTDVIVTNEGFGTESIYEYQIKNNDIYIKINGTNMYTKNNYTPTVSANEIYLFAERNSSGGIVQYNDKPFTIYYFKIYQNDVLVRDYIPVKTIKEVDGSKNATSPTASIPVGTLCMYDKVTNKYYLNSGNVPFTDIPIN